MITIQNLDFYYKKDKFILRDINTELEPGKIYGLLGLNGVGKTTLLKIIAGLRFPCSGSIEVIGFNPQTRTVDFLSDLIFVPDEVDLPKITINQFSHLYSPLYPRFDIKKFENLLDSFKVNIESKIYDLSFGQRKKMYLAFALAANTSILLLDEPTNGLDIPAKSQFRKALSNHVSDENLVIISSHQVRDLHSLIDHILILDDEKLVVDETLYHLTNLVNFTSSPKNQEVLYVENSTRGNLYMIKNTNKEISDFDIEMFFNAITNQPEILNQL